LLKFYTYRVFIIGYLTYPLDSDYIICNELVFVEMFDNGKSDVVKLP